MDLKDTVAIVTGGAQGLGRGIEGVDLVRFLTSQGASVTVSDAKPAEALSVQMAELDNLPVQYSLGENRVEDIASADLLFVSQGVPLTLPAVEAAREAGVPISSMTKLFLERCPGKLVGITGSSGKTTTTALVASMFAGAGHCSLGPLWNAGLSDEPTFWRVAGSTISTPSSLFICCTIWRKSVIALAFMLDS